MRLAYVCADLGVPVFGRKGCSIHVQEVIRALLARGVDVDLFTMRPEGEPPAGLETLRVHALAAPPKSVRKKWGQSPEERGTVPISSERSKGDAGAREAAALRANAMTLAALQRAGPFDAVYERYSLWSHAGMDYAAAQGIPRLLEINAPLIEEQREHRQLIDETGARRVAEQVFSTATVLVAVSEEVAAYVRRFPNTESRLCIVPNGVDPVRFAPDVAPALPGGAGSFTIGFIGSLKPWHGLSTLVEAFALFRQNGSEARLLIVGDGPENSRLLEDINARGLTAVTCLTGAVGANEIPGLLTSMDVAVAPYPPLEHFYFSPLKVYEYMAAGRAVIASRIGQLAELIQHETSGLLYPPGNAAALAAAFERLRHDPALRARLGRAARSRVLRDHTWDGVARRILRLAGVAASDRTQEYAGVEAR
jgi:glycosyltransferase involved in cell wall biosynthesis